MAILKSELQRGLRLRGPSFRCAEHVRQLGSEAQGHALSVKRAQNALANPGSVAAGILPAVVLDGNAFAKAATPADLTDAEIQSALEASINPVL